MPMYRVVSGEFDTTISRLSPQQAATDAIGTLRSGNFDSIRLGVMTIVTLDGGDEADALFVSSAEARANLQRVPEGECLMSISLNGPPRKLTDQKWLNLFELEYTNTKNGHQGKWLYASRNQEPKPGPEPTVANAVIIVPLLKDGRKRKLVMTKEFRIPLGDYEYGVPAGLYDPGEDLLKTAKRELKEETGLKGTRILLTSPACVSSAGLSDEAVEYVFMECTGTPNTDGNQGPEDITVEVLDIDGIRKLRKSGVKISAKVWPILVMFEAMGKIALPRHVRDEAAKDDETDFVDEGPHPLPGEEPAN